MKWAFNSIWIVLIKLLGSNKRYIFKIFSSTVYLRNKMEHLSPIFAIIETLKIKPHFDKLSDSKIQVIYILK